MDQPRRIRAGDADRERVVEALRRAYSEGRLDAEEFGQRTDSAYAATYVDDLPPLLADLPTERHDRQAEHAQHEQHGSISEAWPRWRPLLPILVVALVVLAATGVLRHGFFPFPLFWLAVFAFVMLRRRPGRRFPH